MQGRVYHWKHGWIRLDHEAATSKTAGIHDKRDLAHAIKAVPSLPTAAERSAAIGHVQKSAARLDAHDIVPSQWKGRVPTAAQAAAEKVKAAKAAEPALTKLTSDLAKQFGGRMEGLDFKLKTEDSLARKLTAEVEESGGTLTASQAAEKMFDVNRYTTVHSEANYAHSVQATLDKLRADGHTLRVKNYWNVNENPYQGINVQVTTPSGQKFELQFHTDNSLKVKEGELHRLYELQRVEKSAEKRQEYERLMFKAARKIPMPPGTGTVH